MRQIFLTLFFVAALVTLNRASVISVHAVSCGTGTCTDTCNTNNKCCTAASPACGGVCCQSGNCVNNVCYGAFVMCLTDAINNVSVPCAAGQCHTNPVGGANMICSVDPTVNNSDPGTTPAGAATGSATCGSANGGSFSTAPTINLCSTGNPSTVSGSGPWSWTCGSALLSAVVCSANITAAAAATHGACGTDNGQYLVAPPTNLCSAGVGSVITETGGSWEWFCIGTDNDIITCMAFKPLSRVDGTCGLANGQSYPTAPDFNIRCSTGNPTAVTNPAGAWIWSCAGFNGGNGASCSASITPAGPVCSNNVCESGEACEITAGGVFIKCPERTVLPGGQSCATPNCNITTGGPPVVTPPPAVGAPVVYNVNAVPIGFRYGNVSDMITVAVRAILGVCGFAFFIMLLYGAFKFVTSQGDKTAVTEAQNTISHAIIGVALAAGLFAIMTLLQNILGVSLVNISI